MVDLETGRQELSTRSIASPMLAGPYYTFKGRREVYSFGKCYVIDIILIVISIAKLSNSASRMEPGEGYERLPFTCMKGVFLEKVHTAEYSQFSIEAKKC